MHIYLNSLLKIAHTTQYRTFVVYLMSFSRDSHQEIVRKYLLLRDMKVAYKLICMDYML